jgi:hypothetical protein
MHLSIFQMYLFTRVDVLIGFFIFFLFVSFIFLLFKFIDETLDFGSFVGGASSFLFFSLLLILTPSQKDIAMIYIVPAIVNNENVQELPNDIVKLARVQIEKMIEDVAKPTKDKK